MLIFVTPVKVLHHSLSSWNFLSCLQMPRIFG